VTISQTAAISLDILGCNEVIAVTNWFQGGDVVEEVASPEHRQGSYFHSLPFG